jgi:hypothetical protein
LWIFLRDKNRRHCAADHLPTRPSSSIVFPAPDRGLWLHLPPVALLRPHLPSTAPLRMHVLCPCLHGRYSLTSPPSGGSPMDACRHPRFHLASISMGVPLWSHGRVPNQWPVSPSRDRRVLLEIVPRWQARISHGGCEGRFC